MDRHTPAIRNNIEGGKNILSVGGAVSMSSGLALLGCVCVERESWRHWGFSFRTRYASIVNSQVPGKKVRFYLWFKIGKKMFLKFFLTSSEKWIDDVCCVITNLSRFFAESLNASLDNKFVGRHDGRCLDKSKTSKKKLTRKNMRRKYTSTTTTTTVCVYINAKESQFCWRIFIPKKKKKKIEWTNKVGRHCIYCLYASNFFWGFFFFFYSG